MHDTMRGVDLAKNVFQFHGASRSGEVKFRKKLSREQFRRFMLDQPACVVVFEACGSASYWARKMRKLRRAAGPSRSVPRPRAARPPADRTCQCAAQHSLRAPSRPSAGERPDQTHRGDPRRQAQRPIRTHLRGVPGSSGPDRGEDGTHHRQDEIGESLGRANRYGSPIAYHAGGRAANRAVDRGLRAGHVGFPPRQGFRCLVGARSAPAFLWRQGPNRSGPGEPGEV